MKWLRRKRTEPPQEWRWCAVHRHYYLSVNARGCLLCEAERGGV